MSLKGTMIAAMLLAIASCHMVSPEKASPALLTRVDHLVYATPDLDRGIAELEAKLGVKAVLGGQHPGRGTRNALISLGPSTYLEIFAPDPSQPPPKLPRAFGLDKLRSSKLVAWYVKSDDLDRTRSKAIHSGVPLGEIRAGSRRTSNGVDISWRFTDPLVQVADGIVPLYIDWGHSPHPAESAPKGALLVSLRAEHPDAAGVRIMLEKLGIDLPVKSGPVPELVAVIDCPNGHVILR
jgi:glyoxalase-like protein